jgi:diguanylate cyclase (GGDEF)-like protein/PAS domain S-box-containing protein
MNADMTVDAMLPQDDDVYKTLLESTKAIPWKIDWSSMTFSYIGPQIEALLGWSASSWKSVDDWITRMHPDDRDRVVNFCVSQSKAGVDHEADYRAMTKSGDYIWIRDVVHVIRKGDEVDSLVGFMFDISERKRNEEELLELHKQLEQLSFQDGLTGLANRRMFDSSLEKEWTAAQRHIKPISLIMLDIDFFKQYNDVYGHIQGDQCLKTIASLLVNTKIRPRDVIARFGGEEFAIILPETDQNAAKILAERFRKLILDQKIPHQGSEISEFITVSIGVGTIMPTRQDKVSDFIAEVDKSLYKAKFNGRNMTMVNA